MARPCPGALEADHIPQPRFGRANQETDSLSSATAACDLRNRLAAHWGMAFAMAEGL